MNSKTRKEILINLNKKAEQEALIKKLAYDSELNNTDAEQFSEKIFRKLLDEINIDGLED